MMIRGPVLRLCVLYALAVASVVGADYVVWSQRGDDSQNGRRPETAWRTLAHAAARASSGDTVHLVRGSVFREVPAFAQGVTIVAAGPEHRPPPAIAGSIELRGWKPWEERRGVFVAACPQKPQMLFVDGQMLLLARFPNSGWLKSSDATADSIVDATIERRSNQRDYWKGGQIRWRRWSWWLETRAIAASAGTTLRLAPRNFRAPDNVAKDGGYYIDNLLSELDAPGEWYYDADTKQVYFYPPADTDTKAMTVEAAVVADGPNSMGNTWRGIAFRHFTTGTALRLSRPSVIDGCLFEQCWDTALRVEWNAPGSTIRNSVFRDILNVALRWNHNPERTGGGRIHHNRFERIGTIPGYGGSGTWHAVGIILLNGQGIQVDHNRVYGTGYAGVIVNEPAIIERNVFRDCMQTMNDGAAIYVTDHKAVIRENIVLDTVGDLVSSHPWYPLGHGIWLEFLYDLTDGQIIGNTVVGSGGNGLFLPNNFTCLVEGNTFFANQRAGFRLGGHEKQKRAQNHVIKDNILVARGDRPNPPAHVYGRGYTDQQHCFSYEPGIDFGQMTGTVFSDTTAQWYIVRMAQGSGQTTEDLAAWQRLSWADRQVTVDRGKRRPGSGEAGLPFCFINDTEETRDLPLPRSGTWMALDGQRQQEHISLEPFRSAVLIMVSGSSGGLGSYILASDADAPATTATDGDRKQAETEPASRRPALTGRASGPDETVVATWDARTLARLRELATAQRKPVFSLRGMELSVMAINDAGVMQASSRGMNMNLPYANLDRETKRSLAVSMAKVGATELDHALAAFWLILGRHNRQADQHLGQTSADLAGEVRAAFAGGGAGEPDAE